MGNNQCRNCRIELKTDDWKPYCRGCYQRAFPSCEYCNNPILKSQARIGNYHKFPCYTMETAKCCECFAVVNPHHGDGIYCEKCYDVKNAPPLKMYIKYRDNEFSLHSRDERVLDALKVFSDGLFNALQRNASQRSLIQEPPDNGQSSYWNYTKSYLEYPVRGIRNFVGKRLLSQD
ncbi:hypothetical protein ABFA07_000318 [Porites harrisoni]